jgi:hypothetical protein
MTKQNKKAVIGILLIGAGIAIYFLSKKKKLTTTLIIDNPQGDFITEEQREQEFGTNLQNVYDDIKVGWNTNILAGTKKAILAGFI